MQIMKEEFDAKLKQIKEINKQRFSNPREQQLVKEDG